MGFFARWLVTAVASAVAIWLVPGIQTTGGDAWVGIALFSLALSLVNAFLKPILKFLSFPITLITLGLFALVVNTVLIYAAASLAAGLFGAGVTISSFGSAFFASIVISIVSGIMNGVVGDHD